MYSSSSRGVSGWWRLEWRGERRANLGRTFAMGRGRGSRRDDIAVGRPAHHLLAAGAFQLRRSTFTVVRLENQDAGYTLWISHGGLMNRTTLFQSNRSQAVRLPKDVAFPEGVRSVAILREGKRRVIVPSDAIWDDFFDSPGLDLGERKQPEVQGRELF